MILSLPLLEGLYQRPIESAKVVDEARQLYVAAKRIARWVSNNNNNKQATTIDKPNSKKRRIETTTTIIQREQEAPPQWQHWILSALGSPTLAVRQMAARIILQQQQQQSIADTPLSWLPDALVDYLHCRIPSPADVQCMGLLIELSCNNNNNSTPHLRGWKWASRALVQLATTRKHPQSRATRTRLWLLIDYCHVQSKLSFSNTDRHLYLDYLWNNNNQVNDGMSPLASLIWAHALLSPDLPEPARNRLAQLINPQQQQSMSAVTKGSDEEKFNAAGTTDNTATMAALLLGSDAAPAVIMEEAMDMETIEEVDEEVVVGDDEDDDDEEDDDEEDDDEEDDDEEQVDDEEVESEEEGDVREEDRQEDDDDDDDDEEHEEGQDQEMTETEQEIVDVVRHFEERLLDINDNDLHESRPSSSSGAAPIPAPVDTAIATTPTVDESRKKCFIQAALQVLLHAQYPVVLPGTAPTTSQRQKPFGSRTSKQRSQLQPLPPLLTRTAEQSLLQSVKNVISPPKKPLNLKIFMRRAPTQEEFFRGSLQRNPVSLSNLSSQTPNNETTVRDLRQYIADELQMSETAELIEVLCANKILNLDLKLRVVHQVLWKNHLLENSTSVFSSSLLSSAGGAPTFFSTGSGLSMVFSADSANRGDRRGGSSITADTPASALPPMVVTYRLAGVDGEATEDMVDTLSDPEAPATTSPEEQEQFMEKEFGLTRLVTDGRGIAVLLRSIQNHVRDTLRRIRRDDVVFKRSNALVRGKRSEKNLSLAAFERSVPCSSLTLLKHCTNLPSNRKKLVDARAPTILLRLLLDVLNAIDDSASNKNSDGAAESSSSDQNAQAVSNPTAVMLEDLIETLASDISTANDASEDEIEEDSQGSSTLPLLLSSLKTIYLGPQLRKVISKLLPFLTYGQSSAARELAEHFEYHIKVEKLSDCEAKEQPKTRRFVLMDTFVQAAVSLPPNDVCHSLRSELMKCGFVAKLIQFILEDMPNQPPPWSTALWPAASKKEDVTDLEQSWKYYFLRSGIKTAFDMLVGLCGRHNDLQALVANYDEQRFLNSCHWIESTSNNKTVRINQNGLGLLAETLLDELKEGNSEVAKVVGAVRRKTRDRKKEIANARRSKALVSMSSFSSNSATNEERSARNAESGMSGAIRSSASSFLAPVLDFFSPTASGIPMEAKGAHPAWLAEMEALEDETGLTCAVCQEGRSLQPSELLGLYCYVKKVAIPQNKCGGSGFIDGAMLLMSLPQSLPTSLLGDSVVEHYWYAPSKSVGDSLRSSNMYNLSTVSANRRPTQLTTTVSAGNAIHCSCHSKARSADRNHPKAPKSEWEGASLRNSRVNCNVILPLVSSKSSKVPLVAVDMGLTDYQTAISNLLGARPKAMLWTVLNDVRLLLLRITYGESLNADCGGGSLSSNVSLLFYQLLLADMFTNDAQHDSPQTAKHARSLSGGFLAACKILQADDYDDEGKSSVLPRARADASPMAALTCIVFHNTKEEGAPEPEKDATVPHPKRRWELNKEDFLCGLIASAGRRHALGVEDSGCQNSRKGRQRQSSFSDWEVVSGANSAESDTQEPAAKKRKTQASSVMGKRGLLKIDDFAILLRPMITLYAIFDAMSSTYVPDMTDEMIDESTAVLVKRIEDCQKSKSIHDLLRKAKVTLDNDRIIEELQKGMVCA